MFWGLHSSFACFRNKDSDKLREAVELPLTSASTRSATKKWQQTRNNIVKEIFILRKLEQESLRASYAQGLKTPRKSLASVSAPNKPRKTNLCSPGAYHPHKTLPMAVSVLASASAAAAAFASVSVLTTFTASGSVPGAATIPSASSTTALPAAFVTPQWPG
ncbi:hypothetical protein K438DRAFT_1771857 [Mycena galopus ATCC 62051]|nr:hypothetical protein K438DRAFT_1771857 [Mycena galopus ATCC 62051]